MVEKSILINEKLHYKLKKHVVKMKMKIKKFVETAINEKIEDTKK